MIARYSRPAMARIWSDEGKLARWLEVELAALDGWAEVGAVPEDAAREIRARGSVPSPERVAELEARLHHDTAAFVDAVTEGLGEAVVEEPLEARALDADQIRQRLDLVEVREGIALPDCRA